MDLKADTKIKLGLKEEDIFSNKFFILNRRLLKSVGLWPYQRTWIKRVLRISLIISIYSLMLPQVIRAVQEWNAEIMNLAILIECLTGIFLYLALYARLTMAIVQESKLTNIYEEIWNDIKEINDFGERAVLEHFHGVGRTLSIFYLVYCYVTAIVFATTPAIAPIIINLFLNTTLKKSLCIYVEYFVDQDEYFYYIFSHIVFCIVVLTMLFTAFDTTFVIISQHVVGLLQILKYRLNKLTEVFDQSKYCCTDDIIIHNNLIRCIMIHRKSLQFIKVIDSTYDLYHFCLYLILLSGLSIFTIDIVLNIQDYVVLMRLMPTWCAVIMYIFYFNWPGQKIIDSSKEIDTAIYLCNWYTFSIKSQKLIQFMILRSRNSTFLKAGIFLMSFETCGIILKTAMSYFAVFISLL